MSANIAPAQTTTSATSQLLASASTTATTDTQAAEAAPFAALFQQLIGKQAGIDIISSLSLPQTEGVLASEDTAESTEDLAALLPFLEAMGLAQPQVAIPANEVADTIEPSASTERQLNAGSLIVPAANNGQLPANSAVIQKSANAEQALNTTDDMTQTVKSPFAEQQDAELVSLTDKGKSASATVDFNAQLTAAMAEARENGLASGQHTGAHNLNQMQTEKSTSATVSISPAVGSKSWGDEVGNHVVWMANRQESRAELVLNPPQMGRVEVSLSVTGDQASASFVSSNPAVREALESALPRLREILADAGIQLGQAQVGAESSRQSAQHDENRDNFRPEGDTAHGALPQQASHDKSKTTADLKVTHGLVDVFA